MRELKPKNRIAIRIDGTLLPINDAEKLVGFKTQPPSKVGDEAIALFELPDGPIVRREVICLRSEGMVADRTYLVDREFGEIWPFTIKNQNKRRPQRTRRSANVK